MLCFFLEIDNFLMRFVFDENLMFSPWYHGIFLNSSLPQTTPPPAPSKQTCIIVLVEVYDELCEMKESCGDAHMKVILAIGELSTFTNVYKASIVAMMAGNNVYKTSIVASMVIMLLYTDTDH